MPPSPRSVEEVQLQLQPGPQPVAGAARARRPPPRRPAGRERQPAAPSVVCRSHSSQPVPVDQGSSRNVDRVGQHHDVLGADHGVQGGAAALGPQRHGVVCRRCPCSAAPRSPPPRARGASASRSAAHGLVPQQPVLVGEGQPQGCERAAAALTTSAACSVLAAVLTPARSASDGVQARRRPSVRRPGRASGRRARRSPSRGARRRRSRWPVVAASMATGPRRPGRVGGADERVPGTGPAGRPGTGGGGCGCRRRPGSGAPWCGRGPGRVTRPPTGRGR